MGSRTSLRAFDLELGASLSRSSVEKYCRQGREEFSRCLLGWVRSLEMGRERKTREKASRHALRNSSPKVVVCLDLRFLSSKRC